MLQVLILQQYWEKHAGILEACLFETAKFQEYLNIVSTCWVVDERLEHDRHVLHCSRVRWQLVVVSSWDERDGRLWDIHILYQLHVRLHRHASTEETDVVNDGRHSLKNL